MKTTTLRLLDGLYLACIWISGIAVFLMTLIIPVGVFARYVLGFGAQWPEPIAIILMVVFTFIGAAASYRAGSHIAVGMLTDGLPAAVQSAVAVLVDLLMAGICLFMVFYGGRLAMETMHQTLPELPAIPVGFTYMPLPIGGLITLIFVIERMVFGAQDQRKVVLFDHDVDVPSTQGA